MPDARELKIQRHTDRINAMRQDLLTKQADLAALDESRQTYATLMRLVDERRDELRDNLGEVLDRSDFERGEKRGQLVALSDVLRLRESLTEQAELLSRQILALSDEVRSLQRP